MTKQTDSAPDVLKPCPFCGEEIIADGTQDGMCEHPDYDNGCVMSDSLMRPEAWNTRTAREPVEPVATWRNGLAEAQQIMRAAYRDIERLKKVNTHIPGNPYDVVLSALNSPLAELDTLLTHPATVGDQGEVLRDIADAPQNADWILGWFKTGFTVSPVPIHWACDLSGEEQPAYKGWFRRNGDCGFAEVSMDGFLGWEPVNGYKEASDKSHDHAIGERKL